MPAAYLSAHFVTIDERADSLQPVQSFVQPIHPPKSDWKNCASKRGRRASLREKAWTLQVVRFRANPVTTVSPWLNRRFGHGRFQFTFSWAESPGCPR